MTDKWQTSRSFEETNSHVLGDEILSDVTFLAGKTRKEVKAHKVILASRSPVFYAIFCGSLAEQDDVIEIPDIEEEIFRELLRFLYTEECYLSTDTALNLLYGAKKYDMKRLQDKCRSFLSSQISSENVSSILQHAYQIDEEEIMKKCFSFIFVNMSVVLRSKGILDLSREVFGMLIQSDDFLADELEIYEVCKDWATTQLRRKGEDNISPEAMKKELGELLFLIRFPLMTPDLFANHISNENILSADEKILVFQSFFENSSRQRSDVLFSRTPRQGTTNISIIRFRSTSQAWNNDSTLYGIKFKTSDCAFLAGVSMFSPSENGSITGLVRLLESKHVLTSCSIKIDLEKDSSFKDVLFESSVMLKPDTVYTIDQNIQGVRSYYGTDGQTNVSCKDLDLNVAFLNCDSSYGASTNVKNGQIRGLILRKTSLFYKK